MLNRYALMASFCHKLSGALSHGLSIFQALPLLIKSEKNIPLKKQLIRLQSKLDAGENLAPALIELLGPIIPFQVSPTVEIPDLFTFLVGCETFLKQRYSQLLSIKKQLSYPFVLLLSLLILLIVFLTVLLPMYITFFEDLGQVIPPFMMFIQKYKRLSFTNEWNFIFFLLLLSIFLLGITMSIKKIKKSLSGPFIAANQIKLIVLMLNCGFSFKQSIEQLRYDSHQRAFNALLTTGNIAIFFQETLPLSVYQFERICFSLNNGSLLNTLNELRLELEESANARINALVTLSQPLMIVILGSMVFIFVYFTFIPILDSIAVF